MLFRAHYFPGELIVSLIRRGKSYPSPPLASDPTIYLVANRVIIVGDPNRAELLATLFDEPEKIFILKSNRGFNTYTGKKNGVRGFVSLERIYC